MQGVRYVLEFEGSKETYRVSNEKFLHKFSTRPKYDLSLLMDRMQSIVESCIYFPALIISYTVMIVMVIAMLYNALKHTSAQSFSLKLILFATQIYYLYQNSKIAIVMQTIWRRHKKGAQPLNQQKDMRTDIRLSVIGGVTCVMYLCMVQRHAADMCTA